MHPNAKRVFLWITSFGLALAVLTMLGAWYLALFKEHPRLFVGTTVYIETEQRLAAEGPTPELSALLAQFPHPPGWIATMITEAPFDYSKRVLVADPPELSEQIVDANHPVRRALMRGFKLTSGPTIHGPDGKTYNVVIFQSLTLRFTLNLLMIVGAAFAWLALALWLYADAFGRSPVAGGWLLLGLLTGPLGLAVWLITRPAPHPALAPHPATAPAEAPAPSADACPGCAADPVPGAAFCVRCGFALHPACPDCRRPVEPDWVYCAACGAPLNE